MSISYFASRISPNVAETPERYAICRDACLGRTGTMQYSVGELPQEAAADLGVDVSNPSAMVDVYRSPEELFSPATLASFEGKSCTMGHPSGGQFVDPSNANDLEYGHVQNVRKGDEPLESGDWPLIADIIIKREPLLSQIKNGDRPELSCGYQFDLSKVGNRLEQTKIIGNHVAVVSRGRAGAEARVQDSAPEPVPAVEAPSAPVIIAPPESVVPSSEPEPLAVVIPLPEVKAQEAGCTGDSKQKKKETKMDFKHIFGRGMLALARDEKTTPEEMAEAAKAMPTEKSEGKDETPPAEPKPKFEPEPEPEPVVADKRRAKDAVADAHRAKMHAALDRMLAGKDIEPEPEGAVDPEPVMAEDVDLEELRELLSEFFQEEEQEPEHQEGAEGEPVVADRRAVAADGSFIEPGAGRGTSDEAMAILNALRPHVAYGDAAAVRRVFNGQLARYSRSGKAGKGSYAGFAGAASTRAADIAPNAQTAQQERDKKLQSYYDARFKGIQIPEEVKK
jgi:hypothetical protein